MPCCGSNTSGALTQLAAVGAMDAYTSIAPEATFFRAVYRRHTNFAKAEQCVGFQSSIGFDRCLTAVIPRNGDLIKWIYLRTRLSALGLTEQYDPTTDYVYWTNCVGQCLIKEFTFQIGGSEFDKMTDHMLNIWELYSRKAGNEQGEAIGCFDNIEDQRDFAADDQTLWTFLPLWFARHYELALPLIALQYHDVRVQIQTAARDHLIIAFDAQDQPIPIANVTGGEMLDADLLIDYIYLDTAERRIMAQQPHEFLISQWQKNCCESIVAGTTSKTIQVHFNHIVQEFFWHYQELQRAQPPNNRCFDYGIDRPAGRYPWQLGVGPIPQVDPIDAVSIKFNGHDRVSHMEAKYFRTIQPYQAHSHKPESFAYNYAFAIAPEEDQSPSGGANVSRIDNVVFCFEFTKNAQGGSALENDGELCNYARNHNVMKIAGGMAALRYAN